MKEPLWQFQFSAAYALEKARHQVLHRRWFLVAIAYAQSSADVDMVQPHPARVHHVYELKNLVQRHDERFHFGYLRANMKANAHELQARQ